MPSPHSSRRKGKQRKRVAPTTIAASTVKTRSSPRTRNFSPAAAVARPVQGKIKPKIAFQPDTDNSDSDDDSMEVTIHPKSPATRSTTASPAVLTGRRKNAGRRSPKSPAAKLQIDLSDDESDNDSDIENPTTQQLSCLCWKCHVKLKLPNSTQFCCYAMHVHPVLQVPVCCVCSEEVANHQNGSAGTDGDDICHGCAEPADTMFLCDRCPRQFCSTCVAQANGGGDKGLKFADQLAEEEDDWMCLMCGPEPELEELQQGLDQKSTATTVDQLSQDSADVDSSPKRSVDEILKELDCVEAEQRACEKWDDPAFLAAKRLEISREYERENPHSSADEVAKFEEGEIKRLIKEWGKHDARLGDMATSLQEELEVGHKLDLAKVYRKYFSEEGFTDQNAGEGEEVDPEWKRKADEEIRRRDKAQPPQPIPNILSPRKYEQDTYVDLEDLMTKAEDEQDRSTLGEGFRSTSERPSQRQIEMALKMEDELLKEKKIRIQLKIDNDADAQEENDEQEQTSQQGSNGVSSVRRDTYVSFMKERQKKKKPPPAASLPPVPEETKDDTAADQETANPLRKPKPFSSSAFVDLTDDSPALHQRRKPTGFARNPRKALQFEYWEASKDASDEEDDPDDDWPHSDLVLSSPNVYSSSDHKVKTVTVSKDLVAHLKPHQKEGVQFMWRNACKDLNVRTSNDQAGLSEEKDVGGSILAHSMGLGKSLTTIALLHTLLNHPSLIDQKMRRGMVHTAMLIVPKNTVESWKFECRKWTGNLKPSLLLFVLNDHGKLSRPHIVNQWAQRGGVLVVTKDIFANSSKENVMSAKLLSPGPDVVVVDEAHLCLSSKTSVLYKALNEIRTKRRILLTGSPFQNNVLEYYRMCQWIRPDALEATESAFDTNFAQPIMAGLPSDASIEQRRESSLKSKQLNNILSPFVHRKDVSVLRDFLPALSQVVLHVRPTKVQTRLYTALKRYENTLDKNNFLEKYSRSRPIHNHPACLLMNSKYDDEKVGKNDDDDESGNFADERWWKKPIEKMGVDKVSQVKHGGKIVLLLHILTHAHQIGDKVVVFANCLKTLDYIEQTLQLGNWSAHCKSLKSSFPGTKLGGWALGQEYLRLDGKTESLKRGDLISQFNNVNTRQLFLISRAGNVGITLTAANRVVLMDNHFNPTVMNQALFRCYRFGQEKSVFVYRLLTEGTTEEKVYSRSVNKEGLSMRVIDGKSFEGAFTEQELSNLVLNDTWVCCDKCEKWRMIKGQEEEDLPDKWDCSMNVNDNVNNNCNASEKDNRWYHKHFQLAYVDTGAKGEHAEAVAGRHQYRISAEAGEDEGATISVQDAEAKEAQARKDEILSKLLDDCSSDESKDNKTVSISKYYFHEALLEKHDDEALEPESAAAEENAADDAKPASKPNEGTDDKAAAAPDKKKKSFKEKLKAHKRKESLESGAGSESTAMVETKKRPPTATATEDRTPDNKKKRYAEETAAAAKPPTSQHSNGPSSAKKVKTESPASAVAESSTPRFSLSRCRPSSAKKANEKGGQSDKRNCGKEKETTDISSGRRREDKPGSQRQRKKSPTRSNQAVIELSSDEE
ncbi:ISWI chromatin-remodeling complex ATPase ISW2 [Seminavis robusta]|uniref:ATP-dependent helicase ATRX n=1 Tax=Seminavis robusta TaxID=568900 RepID=A0A9N8HC74_9STRA|nr:ISWI chromatin-remodeling complex ATPase ISW2 [Seminavis robusta]|eukprot:Sro368_g128060.1 ISWI chromatin-remodeling complex ATPase ISW2 (1574) ;mRNA; f:61828-67221